MPATLLEIHVTSKLEVYRQRCVYTHTRTWIYMCIRIHIAVCIYICTLMHKAYLRTCPLDEELSCVQLCNVMDCSPPGSTLLGISQARILEWVAISFSRGSSSSRDRTQVFCIAGGFFTVRATREARPLYGHT